MKKFFTSISVQLWYPNLLLVGMVFSILFFYLPERQKNYIVEIQENTLQQLANTTALSVELSINNDNFSGLNGAVSNLANQGNLDFAAIFIFNEKGEEELFITYPEILTNKQLIEAAKTSIIKESNFNTATLKGKVLVSLSKNKIETQIKNVNKPIYLLLVLGLAVIGIFLFVISFQVTRPIRLSIKIIESLSKRNYNLKFAPKSKSFELNILLEKFEKLTMSLINEQKKNLLLNNSLENKVKSRTTDLEQALIKLEKSEFLSRSILNNGLDAVIAANELGEIIEWNKKATEIFEFEANEAIGRKLSELIIPQHLVAHHIKGMQRFRETKKGEILNKRIELEGKTKSGKQIFLELFIVPLKVGGSTIFTSIIRDVSESKVLNEKLEKQRLLNIKILDSLPLNITLKTKQGEYLIVNDFFTNSLQVKKEQIIGKTDFDIYKKTQALQLSKSDAECWGLRKAGIYEESHDINGKKKYILGGKYIIDIGKNDENSKYLLSFSFDITDRKKIELELEKALKAKDDFLSIMSHEIRTPLHSIIGISDLLQEKKELKNFELLSSLMFSSNQLMVLVNDILDFSKIQSTKFELVYSEFNLNLLIEKILNQFYHEAKRKKISLNFSAPSNFNKNIIFDELRLSQILNNLISNALKFTENGSVSIKYIIEEESNNTAYIKFLIEDTGIGIKSQNLEKIKIAFEQENSGVSRKYGGTGLGLSIVDRLLIKFKSKLLIESKYGFGSTFYFRLKLNLGNSVEQLSNSVVQTNKIEALNKKILYVEDIYQNQLIMKAMTIDFGIKLDLASNAEECIELSNKTEYDLILMDIQMPNINGIMCFEMLKANSKLNKNTAVVAFTANAEHSKVNYYKTLGFKDVLTKPIKKHQLYNFLNSFFK